MASTTMVSLPGSRPALCAPNCSPQIGQANIGLKGDHRADGDAGGNSFLFGPGGKSSW